MFAEFSERTGAKYLELELGRAFTEEERLRRRLISYADRLKDEAERVADGRRYREISAYNPDPLTEYNKAVAKSDQMVETLRHVAWAMMTDVDTAQGQSERFEAWVAETREKARKEVK